MFFTIGHTVAGYKDELIASENPSIMRNIKIIELFGNWLRMIESITWLIVTQACSTNEMVGIFDMTSITVDLKLLLAAIPRQHRGKASVCVFCFIPDTKRFVRSCQRPTFHVLPDCLAHQVTEHEGINSSLPKILPPFNIPQPLIHTRCHGSGIN